ncbi:Zn(II)2Cys6 transcription factor [Aspergillus undulatus]|uniref:Zn(II)2Cys6 transcription factor n=1 Tax=Aspergillus undulatus TaxID=1810928 RepID=UPI003CCCF78D
MSEPNPENQPPTETKPVRVLSCVLCQQRKVRCDRSFPCANCLKAKAQCVPAGLLPRRRKRRFPERELLDRLRQYENLLRQNNINFESLHGEPQNTGDDNLSQRDDGREDLETPSQSSSPRQNSSKGQYEAKNFWQVMNQASPESDNDGNSAAAVLTEDVVKKAWDQGYSSSDPLFGGQNSPVDLSSHHPEPSQILRLWQVYLDNVDPLLKVTHTPTLQVRIIEAVANLKNVNPVLEALMFGIYCMATLSLSPDDCETLFGLPREEFLASHQRSCRQALIQCGFLRSDDRDCLTASYFYLMSLRLTIGDPRALSSMLGIAVRTAQRMGLHSESACARHPPLEAELRRRLWWSMVLFDSRIGEMADYRTTTLTPLWDCKVPRNVNDFDLRPGMKDPPKVQGPSSEALFVVVRGEMGDFLRSSSFHLDFTCPPLKAVAKEIRGKSYQETNELDTLERLIEDRYLRFCDPENPLHFITTWMTRGWLAKCRLLEYFAKDSTARQTKPQRDAAIAHALAMLDCDTRILSNACASRYLWLVHCYFPFPAYIHILQDLRKRPLIKQMEQCWISMGENFEARAKLVTRLSPRMLLRPVATIIFQAWEATESALRQSGQPVIPPKIVSIVKDLLAPTTGQPFGGSTSSTNNPSTYAAVAWSTQMSLGVHNPLSTIEGDSLNTGPQVWMPFDLPAQISGHNMFNPSDWPLINWGM